MATAGAMDGVDPPRVLDVLDIVPQFGRRIGRQAREGSFLPEPGEDVALAPMLGVFVMRRAKAVPSHDIRKSTAAGAGREAGEASVQSAARGLMRPRGTRA